MTNEDMAPAATEAPSSVSVQVVVDWIRDNYQDHTIGSLCDGIRALATPAPAVGASSEPSEQLYRRVVTYEGFGVTGVVFEPVAAPAPASEWLKCEGCGRDMRGHDRMGHCLPAVGASVQPAAGALPPVRWWSGVVGSPEKLANLLDGYSEKKESPRRDERVMRAAAKWIREVGASVQPVLASLSDENRSIGRAINRAAAELPPGAQIRIELERDAGTVYWLDQKHGAWRHIDSGGEPFSSQIDAGIDDALASSTPTKGGEAS